MGARSLNPSSYGQSVTFTATVSPTDGGGSVSFSSNGVVIANCATQPLSETAGSSQATCTTTELSGGTDSIAASYSGDDSYGSSSANPINQTVKQVTPIITWATPAAITYGTALSATQLDATASVPGTFDYTPVQAPCSPPDGHTLSSTFTPTEHRLHDGHRDRRHCDSVTQTTPTITWADAGSDPPALH